MDAWEIYIDSLHGEFKAELKLNTWVRSLKNHVKTDQSYFIVNIFAFVVSAVKLIQKPVLWMDLGCCIRSVVVWDM